MCEFYFIKIKVSDFGQYYSIIDKLIIVKEVFSMNLLGYIILNILFLIIILFKYPVNKRYKETDYLYTALGDDISKSPEAFLLYGFVYRIKQYLKLKNTHLVFNNFAKPLFTSSQLLWQLKNDSYIRQCVKKSKVITISIGGNNLLDGVFKNFSDIDGRACKDGIKQFREDWPNILYFIRNSIGSKASIYIMTLYNPYSYDDRNYSMAEYYVSTLNLIIKSGFWIKTLNYKVVDIHEYFRGNFQQKYIFLSSYIRQPLPNYKEYKKIAEAFINTISA